MKIRHLQFEMPYSRYLPILSVYRPKCELWKTNRACCPWWSLLGLLSWCPIFKSSHCDSLGDRTYSLPGAKLLLQWRHNERDGVPNHRRLDCLFNWWPLEMTGEKVSIWWRHHIRDLAWRHAWISLYTTRQCFVIFLSYFLYFIVYIFS